MAPEKGIRRPLKEHPLSCERLSEPDCIVLWWIKVFYLRKLFYALDENDREGVHGFGVCRYACRIHARLKGVQAD